MGSRESNEYQSHDDEEELEEDEEEGKEGVGAEDVEEEFCDPVEGGGAEYGGCVRFGGVAAITGDVCLDHQVVDWDGLPANELPESCVCGCVSVCVCVCVCV